MDVVVVGERSAQPGDFVVLARPSGRLQWCGRHAARQSIGTVVGVSLRGGMVAVQRFIQGATVWPSGWTKLHVYVTPRPDRDVGLWRLIALSREVMADYPAVVMVPDEWLHATVQMVDGRPAADVDADQRAALVDALHHQVAAVPAFDVVVGPAMANRAGVLLDMDGDQPGEPWAVLSGRVRAAIGEVFGESALSYEPGPPHVTLGYAGGGEDSGIVQSRLRRHVRPGRAGMHVDAVILVDVIQDQAANAYRWTQIARVPLGGGGPA